MNYLSKEEMERLPTKRLLAYKKKWLKSPEYPYHTCFNEYSSDDSPFIEDLKLVKEYHKAYTDIISVLNTREHVERRK